MVKDSGLLGCDTVSLAEYLPKFRRIVLSPSSRSSSSRRNFLTSSETSGNIKDRKSVTSQKTQIFNNTAVRSSNLATRQFMTVPTTASHLSLTTKCRASVVPPLVAVPVAEARPVDPLPQCHVPATGRRRRSASSSRWNRRSSLCRRCHCSLHRGRAPRH